MRVITGSARGVRLQNPRRHADPATAERVKEAVFSSLHQQLPLYVYLFLFAGTGQMGIEALSRGASRCVFVDSRRDAVALVQENLRRTRHEAQAQVVQADYLSYLNRCREQFDLICWTRPYAEVFLENALQRITEIDILSDGGIIITERPVEKCLDGDFSV